MAGWGLDFSLFLAFSVSVLLKENENKSEPKFLNFYGAQESIPRNRFQGIDSASLCDVTGHYDNPICRTGPPGYKGKIDSLDQFLGFLKVYKFGPVSMN
jgi:hypothetical protein